MPQEIIFNTDVHDAISQGVNTLANAVKVTLGPKGRNVILQRKFGLPIVTKDGVTVAKEIHLSDKFQEIGAQMVKEVASRTNELAGDGTTTATVLAQAIYTTGRKYIASGANAMEIQRGINHAVEQVVASIKEMSQPINSTTQLGQVALISANHDKEIADVVTEAIEKVGKTGRVTVMESKTGKTAVEIINGFVIDRGYVFPHCITNQERGIVEYNDPLILIYDGDLSTLKLATPLLEKVAAMQRPLLVVANKTEGDVLATMAVNNMRGNLKSCAINSPGFSHRRPMLLEDLAMAVNTVVVNNTSGFTLDKIMPSQLGTAARVIVTASDTTIIGGTPHKDLPNRITYLEGVLSETKDSFEKENLQERLANLNGSVAVIHVGAKNEIELREKKDRIEDALNATKAAMEEGIIPGGGVAYLLARGAISTPDGVTNDFRFGTKIIVDALTLLTESIASNAGLIGGVVINKIEDGRAKHKCMTWGYDAGKDKYVDMIAEGIIDTTKVARIALENAGSIAGLLLTTDCLIASDTEENPQMMI